MKSFNRSKIRCDGISRRDFLHLGMLSTLGLSAADLFRLQANSPAGGQKQTSCILIWLDGGPSHLDTFDLKPDAPSEIRSAFGEIPTSVPGLRICEHLPRTARIMDRVALIRSLTHELGNHDTGARFMLTGNRPGPSLEFPSLGSIVASRSEFQNPLPPYIAIPADNVGGNSGAAKPGFLSAAFSAFNVGNDPSRVQDLNPPEGVTFARTERRREMLERMDAFSKYVEEGKETQNRDAFYTQAYRLISSPEAKAAFDLSREAGSIREQYGNGKLGTGCLLARRLIEAGSRFVTVIDHGWDTHNQIFRELPDSRFPGSGKLPNLDRAFAALIRDLAERGLLDSTLVVMMGEFGRTPKLNANGGRDHWPRAGFAVMAGAGVTGGALIGATDQYGEAPVERPVTPPDLAFTILKLLGINPSAQIVTPSGRPVRILNEGMFISELV